MTPLKFIEVTRGHQQFFANNLRSKLDREVGLVSLRSSGWRTSGVRCKAHRMMYNLAYLGHRVTLPWLDLRSNFDLDLSKVKLYMVRRALTRQTRWYQHRCSTFKIKDFIVQKPFWKILEFWPLVTSILTWAKKWPKWFRNDFSRAFERRFPICSTMRRSRDRRGVFKHPVVENPEAHQGAG